MSTNSLYYKESGKIPPLGPVLMIAVGGGVAWLLAFVYAYAIFYIPFIYLNVIFACVLGGVVGALVSLAAKGGKVRNKTVSTVIAGFCGVLAIYFAWAFWLGIYLELDSSVYSLDMMLDTMSLIGQFGAWEVFGSTPTGIALYLFWVVEALLVIVIAAVAARHVTETVPYCESCAKWSEEKEVTNLLPWNNDTSDLKKKLETGNFDALLNMPLSGTPKRHSTVKVYHCPSCDAKHHLTVTRTSVSVDSDGNDEENVDMIVQNLIIDKSDYQRLVNWERPTPPTVQTPETQATP